MADLVHSYGAITEIFKFCGPLLSTQFQGVSVWFYRTAVGRAQTKVRRITRAYFLNKGGDNIVAEVRAGANRSIEKRQDLDFDEDWIYVQLGNDLYCLENVYSGFCKLVNEDASGYFRQEELAPMLNDRFNPALSCLNETYIFASGGYSRSSVERYTVAQDSWTIAPSMRLERHSHSSVALGFTLYVLCGEDGSDNYTNSIEKLDCSNEDLTNEEWILISAGNKELEPRIYPFVAALQDSHIIVILGGYHGSTTESRDGYLTDIVTFDTESNECQKLFGVRGNNALTEICSFGNECRSLDQNTIAIHATKTVLQF